MKTKGLLLLVFLTLLNVLSFAQVSGNLLKIQGEAVIYETPEEMAINILIFETDSLYSKCNDLLIQKNNKLITLLIGKSVPKDAITSDQIRIERNISWEKEKTVQKGYIGSIGVQVILKFNSQQLNDLLNTLKNDSLNVTSSVSFQLSAAQKEKLLKDATKLAITDAQNKATLVAESLKLKDLKIKEINYGYPFNSNNELILSESKHLMYMADISLQLNPRKIEVKKAISIVWEFKQ